MSTRSVIAKPTNDGGWKGRYVHNDGYPDHMVNEYLRLVQEKGVERCIDVLINWHAGWSQIIPDPHLSEWNDDGRFSCVSNYGIAYTVASGQTDWDEWRTSDENPDDMDWAYVLHSNVLEVWENVGDVWTHHSTIPYDSPVYLNEHKYLVPVKTPALV